MEFSKKKKEKKNQNGEEKKRGTVEKKTPLVRIKPILLLYSEPISHL